MPSSSLACKLSRTFKVTPAFDYTIFYVTRNCQKKSNKQKIFDFGIIITNLSFSFERNYCELPTSLVIAYTLAVANSGLSKEIILAGFDGYNADDPRRKEMDQLLKIYKDKPNTVSLTSITPTSYEIPVKSIYGMSQWVLSSSSQLDINLLVFQVNH